MSTRELGVLVATHGDDKGLVLPPKVAYVQVAIVPIYKKENEEAVMEYARRVAKALGKYRIVLDDREGYSPGFKFNEWELKGVPVRLEVGGREVESKKVVLVRRDTGEKSEVALESIAKEVGLTFKLIQSNMYEKAVKFLDDNIHDVKTYDEFKATLKEKGGIIRAPWCGGADCEGKMKDETGAKITNIPLKGSKARGVCVYCKQKAEMHGQFCKVILRGFYESVR